MTQETKKNLILTLGVFAGLAIVATILTIVL